MGTLGAFAGVGTLALALISNTLSDTPIWASEMPNYLAAALLPIMGLTIGITFSSAARLPKPSRVAVSVELAVQNKILAAAIIHMSFPRQDDFCSSNEAVIIPFVYVLFGTGWNVL